MRSSTSRKPFSQHQIIMLLIIIDNPGQTSLKIRTQRAISSAAETAKRPSQKFPLLELSNTCEIELLRLTAYLCSKLLCTRFKLLFSHLVEIPKFSPTLPQMSTINSSFLSCSLPSVNILEFILYSCIP